jgi:predicted helicase
MPCGSGKSLTAYWIAGELGARSIVIAVPSLALIRQTLKVWLRETQANQQAVEWICVCSDESAGRVERDDSAVLRQDLGVPCLTDPQEIAAWLKRKHRGLSLGRLPEDIPAAPWQTYADKGWSGMGDWLGTDHPRVSKSPKRKS